MKLLIALDIDAVARTAAKRIAGPDCTPVVASSLDAVHAAWAQTEFDVVLVASDRPNASAIALLSWTRGARVIAAAAPPYEVAPTLTFIGAEILHAPFSIAELISRLKVGARTRRAA